MSVLVGWSGGGSDVVGTTGLTLVDLAFFRVWSRCPLAVATDRGGCRLKVLAVKPGILRTYPRCSAFSRVLRAGENNAACEYATNSAACGYPIVVNAAASGSIVVVAVGETGIMNCHNPGGGCECRS